MVGGPIDAEGRLELAGEAGRIGRARRGPDARLAALAMGDEHGLAQALVDGRRGVAHVDHERAAADGRAVDPGRRDAEIVRDRGRRLAGGGDAVDVRRLQAGILHGVEGGVGMQLDLRHAGDDAEVGGLGGADDGDGFGFHGLPRVTCRGRLEEGQGDLVGLLLEGDLEGHVEHQGFGRLRAADDVGHHARALVQLDDGDRIGRREAGRRAMVDDVAEELGLAARP